jgi:hypothetical protein
MKSVSLTVLLAVLALAALAGAVSSGKAAVALEAAFAVEPAAVGGTTRTVRTSARTTTRTTVRTTTRTTVRTTTRTTTRATVRTTTRTAPRTTTRTAPRTTTRTAPRTTPRTAPRTTTRTTTRTTVRTTRTTTRAVPRTSTRTTTPTTVRPVARTTATRAVVTGAGPVVEVVPVLLYQEMNNPDSLYSVNDDDFSAQMAYLKAQGYASITPDEYVQWLQGNTAGLPAKPVLITFEGNMANTKFATDILTSHGFSATMFVATGLADKAGNSTTSRSMSWAQLAALKAAGWSFQMHSGPNGRMRLPNQACNYFVSCRLRNEAAATYQARISAELDAGEAALIAHELLDAAPQTISLPWDSWGQSGEDQAVWGWLPAYLATRYAVVFQQSRGYSIGAHRRYRYEVTRDITLDFFASSLNDARFARSLYA